MPRRFALIGNQAFSMLNFRSSLIAALVEKGIEVFALAPDYTEAQRHEMRALGAEPVDFKMQRNGLNPIQDGLTLLSLVAALRKLKPDTVLSYAIKPSIYGTLAAALARAPRRFVLIEGLGHVFLGSSTIRGRMLKTIALTLYRIALSKARKVFFLNTDDRTDFLAHNLLPQSKTIVVGAIGIDIQKWSPCPPVLSPMTFIFVGRLLREKGIVEFIDAARAIKIRHDDTRFVVLGDVDTNPSSINRTQVSQWVAEGLIEWPGHVSVKDWLAQSSVFVLPSYREGMPRSTQEAMGMGLPVITTDVPGCRETVVDGLNGYLIPAKSSQALSQAIEKFMANPDLVGEMGKQSRQIAEARFNERTFNETMIRSMGLAN